jgi:hypothetical protein
MRRMLQAGVVAVTVCGVALGQSGSGPAQPPPRSAGATDVAGALPPPSLPTAPVACPPDSLWSPAACDCPGCGPAGHFWVGLDYLLWQVKGDSLPPLVTTSPAGTPRAQAGVEGTPGVSTLFGGSHVNDDWRSGGRVRVGSWLDCQQTLGVEANFFMLANAASWFDAASSGTPIVSRPFFNAVTGQPDAELIAFPGIASGTVSVRDTSTLLGAGFWLRCNLCCEDCYRVDALLGYRYLGLTDRLAVTEDLVSTDPNSPTTPLGTRLTVNDQFYTANDFHGADLGLTGEFRRGPWALEWLAKVAVGPNAGVVDVGGTTTVAVPGFAPKTAAGGLLALSSNSGHFNKNRVSVVPEVGARLGYQFTPHLRAFVGYDFLYWTDVVRPGGQIDTTVNPNLLPPVVSPVTGPNRPAPRLTTSDVWVQGLSLGLEVRY